MTAAAWTPTNSSITKLFNGQFDIDSDSWKVALFLSTSNIGASSTTYAGVTNELANGSGYTTGGVAVTLVLSGTNPVKIDFSVDPVWTASGASLTFRYGVLYEVGGDVLAYSLLDTTPADTVVVDGNEYTLRAHATNGILLATWS